MLNETILSEIHDFLRERGMKASYFGRLACGDSKMVRRLENGGSITLTTAEKVRAYIKFRQSEEA